MVMAGRGCGSLEYFLFMRQRPVCQWIEDDVSFCPFSLPAANDIHRKLQPGVVRISAIKLSNGYFMVLIR
jgi:hypothetical protein